MFYHSFTFLFHHAPLHSQPQPKLTAVACSSQGLHVALGFSNGDTLACYLGPFDKENPLMAQLQRQATESDKGAEKIKEALGERGMILFTSREALGKRDIPQTWTGLFITLLLLISHPPLLYFSSFLLFFFSPSFLLSFSL